MLLRLVLRPIVAFALLTLATSTAFSEGRRVALVVGNSNYLNSGPLSNPKNDATDLAGKLKELGFKVIFGTDLNKAGMDRTIRDFADALNGAEVGLFFYAGHGLQVGGDNYLVPIDAKLTTAAVLDFEMVRLDLIQRTMERETQTNIIILDACRDNPLARNLARAFGTRSSSVGSGLAKMESGEGTLVSFSTQPGNVALDGEGRNSPFTEALLSHIGHPGEDLSSILISVRNDVMKVTARHQVPWENSALTAKFYFIPPAPGPTAEQQIELEFWKSVKDSSNPEVLRSYLAKYPNGNFVPLAQALIKQIEQQAAVAKATREEEKKRQEEEKRAAEVRKLEEERKSREAALFEERKRAENSKNTVEALRLDQQRRGEDLRHAEELRKALDALRVAREAAAKAEEKRLGV